MNLEPAILFSFLLAPVYLSQDCDTFNSSWLNYCPERESQEMWCYNWTGGNQDIKINKNQYTIDCRLEQPNVNVIQCSLIKTIKILTMIDCQFTNVNFKDFVGDIDPKELIIRYTERKHVDLGLKFEGLRNLRNIFIRNVASTETFPVIFGKKLTSLEGFYLEGHSFKEFKEAFKNLKELSTLRIRHGPVEVLNEITLVGVERNLVSLDLSWNALRKIEPNTFKHFRSLRSLDLSKNELKQLHPDLFLYLSLLRELKLDRNLLKSIRGDTFSSLRRLQFLNISHNPLLFLPHTQPFGPSIFLNVSAEHCQLSELPSLNWNVYRERALDLSHNYITRLVLPLCTRGETIIKLTSNKISSITLFEDCKGRYTRPRYFLAGNKPKCDCDLRQFLHFVRLEKNKPNEVFPDLDQLYCRGTNESLLNTSAPCPKIDCPPICFCHFSTAICSNRNLTAPPVSIPLRTTIAVLANNQITSLKIANSKYWDHVTHLNLSSNSLSSLDEWEIPKNLRVLDIRSNHLQNLPLPLMQFVEASVDFRVYLSDNKWWCNCELVFFKEWLMENTEKMADSAEVYCKLRLRSGSVVRANVKDTSVDNFCYHLTVDSHVFLILLPIAIIAILVYTYYYKQTVFPLLYSWNLLRCSYFNPPVEEKTYDAFVCANQADRALVIECMKQLEPQYRLCIPERDWPKEGRFGMSTHVANSFNNSRAALFIASDQSLQETWFQVKFRGAFNKRLEDEVYKMIIITVGDISNVSTKKDIRQIISTEPCLVWGERFLWQKLRYELRRPYGTFQ